MAIDGKHESAFKVLPFSRSASNDSLESNPLDVVSMNDGSPTAMSLGNLANLPTEIIYCIFEVMDPCATIGFALTNTPNLSIYTQWLDTTSSLQNPDYGPGAHEMFDFIRKRICKTATMEQRRDAAAALRLWQRKVLQDRSPIKKWNVCNGCLEFKQDHCTACIDEICATFICHPYCVI